MSRVRQTDVELLEAVRGGNTSAYGMLYQRHAAAARCLARQLVQGDEEVEDVLVETFAGVLDLIRRGGGPVSAFRPYLLTAVRRYVATGEVDLFDPGSVYVDPELAGLERSPLARAYLSLPERWRMVLWHTDVEGAGAAAIAPLLGLPSKGVGALSLRAREGLRQAYLQLHKEEGPTEGCRQVLPKIVLYVEGGLPKRDARVVDEHVAECIDCRSVFLELADVTQGLRVIVGQLVAGPAVDDYLAGLGRASEGSTTRLYGVAGLFRGVPTPHRAAMVGMVAAAVAAAAFLLVLEPIADERPTPLVGEPAPTTSAVSSGTPSAATMSATPRQASRPAETPLRHPPLARRPHTIHRSRRVPPPVARERARRPEPVARRPALAATVDPLGALVRARLGIIAVRLVNTGTGRSQEVEAAVGLPPGVTLVAAGGRKGRGTGTAVRTVDGWACRTAGRLVRCARRALAPGEVTAVFLRVDVAADAPTGRGFGASVRSGALEVAARSAAGVRASGPAARFAADGRVTTRAIGNTLLSSVPPPADCEYGTSHPSGRARGNPGVAVPVDLDGDASTRSSSCARLDLPAGSRVLWAGLYWSATGRGAAPAGDILVRAPGARRYLTVHAAEVVRRDLPTGSGYQGFSDVTSLARTAGGGRWWVADASTRAGAAQHTGWSLVVMATDERQPYSRAAVLDMAQVVDTGKGVLTIPLDGLAPVASPARVDLVMWNGGGVKGGSVTLSDQSRPGARGRHNGSGLGRNTEGGGVVLNTFHTLLGRHPVLHLATRQNGLFFGVAAVSAHTWS